MVDLEKTYDSRWNSDSTFDQRERDRKEEKERERLFVRMRAYGRRRAQQVLIRKHNARNIPKARMGTHSEHMAPYLRPREDPPVRL